MPAAPFFRGIGARHHREQARLVGVGDEALGAVEDIDDRRRGWPRGLQRSRVRARLRLGQREELATISPDASLGSHSLFCSGVPNMTRPWLPMPTLVPKHGAEGRRGVAKLESRRSTRPPWKGRARHSPRDRKAEEAQLAHLGDDRIGHAVVLGDLGFDGHASLAYEAAHRFDQLRARFGIERHACLRHNCPAGD